MLTRARAINDNDKLLYRIERITAFGSYITDAQDLGDIDLAVETGPRRGETGPDWSDVILKYAHASGRNLSFDAMLRFPETEVMTLLKARNRYLQFCRPDMLERLRMPTRRIFPIRS